ncbi:MAG: hypothetical protein WBR26_04545 [Candidatus Acidiferrum sp.]
MNQQVRNIGLSLAVVMVPGSLFAQAPHPAAKKTSSSQNQTKETQEFGKSYENLRPAQRRLIDDYVHNYNETTDSKIVAQSAYDDARLSVRTTFDAVTHALLNAKISDADGKSLGHAIDLVASIDDVMGEEAGLGGDRQFRLYVYLKPNAYDALTDSQELFRDRDNTMYHKGFPICFRLENGPPSIQISISRDHRMADIDVDYRSSKFPQALFNGHLSAANSDVRAGDNLDRHDRRWQGLNGWWRDLFGFSLGSAAGKIPEETEKRSASGVPLNPRVKSNRGIDEAAHDFLNSWVVERKPNDAIAYFSRRSYSCLEEIAATRNRPVAAGMVRVRLKIAMDELNQAAGDVSSVSQVFESADKWFPDLKEVKNAYPAEFRAVSVPTDLALASECVPELNVETVKKSKEKFYATEFREKVAGQNTVVNLLWVEERKYWRIVAISALDAGNADITPHRPITPAVAETAPERIAGDPKAIKDITDFYDSWIVKRDLAGAMSYVSERSYGCLSSLKTDGTKPSDRIRAALEEAIEDVPREPSLSAMMSSVPPVNELARPVDHDNSKAFAIMAVPDQMAGSFLCERRHLPDSTPELRPSEAKYGIYFATASRLNFGDEESPALLLLWMHEKDRWKIVAWAIEVP